MLKPWALLVVTTTALFALDFMEEDPSSCVIITKTSLKRPLMLLLLPLWPPPVSACHFANIITVNDTEQPRPKYG